MPIKHDNLVFTGTQDVLTCYYSKGRNLTRKSTSLNAERVRKDPAFKGFRESCSRMRQASPIAASLYARIPAKHREYPLYRVLTGAAIKLLKQGVEQEAIKALLAKEYIDPLIAAFLEARRPVAPRPDYSSPFSYSRLKTFTPVRNHARIRSGRSAVVTAAALPLNSRKANVRYLPGVERLAGQESSSDKDLPGLIYLGRIAEAPKLKMYQREDAGLVIGLNSSASLLKFL